MSDDTFTIQLIQRNESNWFAELMQKAAEQEQANAQQHEEPGND